MSEGPGWGNVGQEIRKVVAKRSGDNVAGTILRFFLFLFFCFLRVLLLRGSTSSGGRSLTHWRAWLGGS